MKKERNVCEWYATQKALQKRRITNIKNFLSLQTRKIINYNKAQQLPILMNIFTLYKARNINIISAMICISHLKTHIT